MFWIWLRVIREIGGRESNRKDFHNLEAGLPEYTMLMERKDAVSEYSEMS